jgi:hypothetical protein
LVQHRVGPRRRGAHEGSDQVGRMLAVGVHRQGMRESCRPRRRERMQDGSALALVLRKHLDAQTGIVGRERAQAFGSAVAAAVDDDPHRRPCRTGRTHRLVDQRPGVVARNDDEVRRRRRLVGGDAHRRRASAK